MLVSSLSTIHWGCKGTMPDAELLLPETFYQTFCDISQCWKMAKNDQWLCFTLIIQDWRKLLTNRQGGLALVLDIEHFHQYLWGVKLTLEIDHKPLLSIFGKCISTMAATRFQRYATFLTDDIKYQTTDAMSGLPLPTIVEKLLLQSFD